jgi:hypothetical protein
VTAHPLADLAERLREAHRRVASLSLDHDEKACLPRALHSITNLAKRDLARGSERLDAFLREFRSRLGNGLREPE